LDKIVEENQLFIALKFLKSPYLEKRVKGVTEIKEFTEKIET
jgi:ubiquitin carboxyl-terminal hydrolase 9/24